MRPASPKPNRNDPISLLPSIIPSNRRFCRHRTPVNKTRIENRKKGIEASKPLTNKTIKSNEKLSDEDDINRSGSGSMPSTQNNVKYCRETSVPGPLTGDR